MIFALCRYFQSKTKEKGLEAMETFARKGSDSNPSGSLELYLMHNFGIENGIDDFPLLCRQLWLFDGENTFFQPFREALVNLVFFLPISLRAVSFLRV